MHELSLARSIVQLISEDAQKKNIKQITLVRLVAGELSSANNRALMFALENLVKGTLLSEAKFEVSVREAREKCRACSREFRLTPPFFCCPACGKPASSIEEGRKVYIDYYEGE